MSDARKKIAVVFIVILSALFGFYVRSFFTRSHPEAITNIGEPVSAQVWTCSMHPQIRQPEKGLCPICAMELIPVVADTGTHTGEWQLKLSENAIKRAQVETATVERKFVTKKIRMVGKVAYDETQLAYITAWVPGRIDKLYVDYTGIPVKTGDHMADLYSPELISAQEELIQAVKTSGQSEGMPVIKDIANKTIMAVREKLRLWGLTDEQIQQIEQKDKPSTHITISSPLSGIVIHKNAFEGMYVQTGTKIYTVADLTHLWVKLDAYESDLVWLRYGQDVIFYTEAYTGEQFEGKIVFIDPVIDSKTRTVKVRVNVDNSAGKLKPDMFVRAVVKSTLAEDDKIVSGKFAGKWISPMHPEIVKDHPGTCDVCGMPLVSAESLGFVSDADAGALPPLVIPHTAPLITGQRAVVYVAVSEEEGLFEGREILLGARADDHYIVREGLSEGEQVVVRGVFKIDSAIQIQAKKSMMNMQDSAHHSATGYEDACHTEKRPVFPEKFLESITPVYTAYFSIQTFLSKDNLESAIKESRKLIDAVNAVDKTNLDPQELIIWNKYSSQLISIGEKIVSSNLLQSVREQFQPLSDIVTGLVKEIGFADFENIYMMQCPMAFDNKGAGWLQREAEIANPYFGAAMFRCGEQKTVFKHSAQSR